MDPKEVKLYDFAHLLRTDNWAELMRMDLKGISFQDAIKMVAMFHRNINFHNRISRDLNALLSKTVEIGYETEELPVL